MTTAFLCTGYTAVKVELGWQQPASGLSVVLGTAMKKLVNSFNLQSIMRYVVNLNGQNSEV